MAKIKVQVVKEKKKGILRKVIWGVIGLIGFLASLVTVIDFMSNNKGYVSRLVDGVKNIFGIEEPEKKEIPKKDPVLKAEPEKTQPQENQKQPENQTQEPVKDKI